jgi:subtilisin-like proprotein convertase family protein
VAGTVLNTVYASPATTTTYTVTGVLGTCSVPSGTVTVTVNPRPTISVTPNNQCGPVTLTASGTSNTYSWSPAAGLSATTGATVTANPTVNTVYTVTGTITTSGCTNTASVTVNATPPAPVVTPTSVTICSGAIATLTAASGNGTATATSGTISVAIPDNNPAGANHTLVVNSVPAGATITDVSVNFNVTHTFDGDLILNLRAPNNNVLNLVNRRGGGGDNFVNTTISSTASSPISGGTAPFTGTYTADGANAVGPTGYVSNVTAFSGLTSIPNGNWTLAISDNAGADIGTLTSWTVNITYTLPNAIWTPVTGLFTNPTATIPYVAGTPLNTVYAKPTTTTTYSVTRTTGTCASPAATVTVTVISPIAITTQPASVTTCAGANATFSVVATGNLLTYQWQISTDGGTTWNPIAGATGASLVVPSVTTTMTNNRYRVVITNSCNTVTSSAATLTVNALTPPTVTTLANRICLSDTLVPLVGLPAGGTWTGVGVSGNNFVPSATAVGTYTLTYTYRNAQNCTASATVVAKVEDCPERLIRLTDNAVILYPNPNNGLFNIRINSTLYNYLGMRVYNVQGQLLRIQNFNGLVYGRVIPVDLRHLPGGTYMVKFYYDDGVRTSDKTFKVVIAR